MWAGLTWQGWNFHSWLILSFRTSYGSDYWWSPDTGRVITNHGAFFTEGLNTANPLKSPRRLLLAVNGEAGTGSGLEKRWLRIKGGGGARRQSEQGRQKNVQAAWNHQEKKLRRELSNMRRREKESRVFWGSCKCGHWSLRHTESLSSSASHSVSICWSAMQNPVSHIYLHAFSLGQGSKNTPTSLSWCSAFRESSRPTDGCVFIPRLSWCGWGHLLSSTTFPVSEACGGKRFSTEKK